MSISFPNVNVMCWYRCVRLLWQPFCASRDSLASQVHLPNLPGRGDDDEDEGDIEETELSRKRSASSAQIPKSPYTYQASPKQRPQTPSSSTSTSRSRAGSRASSSASPLPQSASSQSNIHSPGPLLPTLDLPDTALSHTYNTHTVSHTKNASSLSRSLANQRAHGSPSLSATSYSDVHSQPQAQPYSQTRKASESTQFNPAPVTASESPPRNARPISSESSQVSHMAFGSGSVFISGAPRSIGLAPPTHTLIAHSPAQPSSLANDLDSDQDQFGTR